MRNKYNARKTVIDGHTFDSRREADRYCQLRLLERAGEIHGLELQKEFELIPAQYETFERYGKRGQRLKDGRRCVEKPVVYRADFCYTDNKGRYIVEDVKGCTRGAAYQVFVIKRKLMRDRYEIEVREIKK